MGKVSSEAKNRWNAKAYDRVSVLLPKGMRDAFKAACLERGISMNAVIRDAVERFLDEGESD